MCIYYTSYSMKEENVMHNNYNKKRKKKNTISKLAGWEVSSILVGRFGLQKDWQQRRWEECIFNFTIDSSTLDVSPEKQKQVAKPGLAICLFNFSSMNWSTFLWTFLQHILLWFLSLASVGYQFMQRTCLSEKRSHKYVYRRLDIMILFSESKGWKREEIEVEQYLIR